MMKKPKFYGSTTVGERGQIVLPVKLRNDFKINKGDKLVVIGHPGTNHISLFNEESMNKYLEMISENINQMRAKIQKKR